MKKILVPTLFTVLALVALAPAAIAEPITFGIDASHSSVAFKVRHFFTQVPGHFDEFEGTIVYDPANPAASSVEMTVQAASIDTGNANRDEHLRSADFFDAATYPTLSFKSVSVEKAGEDQLSVLGDFTMHGKTKRLTLTVNVLGLMKGDKARAGFATEFKIDRKEFDIVWNRTLDEGGRILGDEVTIAIDLEVVQK